MSEKEFPSYHPYTHTCQVPHKMSEKEFWQRYLRSKTRSQQPPVPAASSTGGGDMPAEP